MIESPGRPMRRPRRHLRLTIGTLMLVVALAGLWFAWIAARARRVAVVDLGRPDLTAVGDRPHTAASLRGYLRGTPVDEVAIRCPVDMPLDSVLRVVQAIQQAGVPQIRFTNASGSPNPALQRTRPAAAAPGNIRSPSGGPGR